MFGGLELGSQPSGHPIPFVSYNQYVNECMAGAPTTASAISGQSNLNPTQSAQGHPPLKSHLLHLNTLRVRNLQSLEAALSRDFLLQLHHALLIARRIRRHAFEFPGEELVGIIGFEALVEDAEAFAVFGDFLLKDVRRAMRLRKGKWGGGNSGKGAWREEEDAPSHAERSADPWKSRRRSAQRSFDLKACP